MPVGRYIQTSFTSGEFNQLLWSREDVTFFYSSARVIENLIPLPKGGVKRREGLKYAGRQRGDVSQIAVPGSFTTFTITAANGGGGGNLVDGDESTTSTTTTGISTTAEYEVFKMEFVPDMSLTMADLRGVVINNLPSGVTSATLQLQYSDDDITYTTFASMVVGNTAYGRRFFTSPINTSPVSARYWRVIVSNPGGATDYGSATVTIADVMFFTNEDYSDSGATSPNWNLARITTSITDEYFIVLQAFNADIYSVTTGAFVASVYIPHTAAQVPDIKYSTYLDTIVLYHEDVRPFIIQRIGGDTLWRSDDFAFASVPRFPFASGTVSGGVNEIQELSFLSFAGGEKIRFEYSGQVSSEINWAKSTGTDGPAIKAALEGLDDITSVTVTAISVERYQVEFTGVDGKQSWATIIPLVLTGSGIANNTRVQYGRPDTDDLWSATRGYPRCGTFYQGRHWMAGFKARPDVIAASRAGAMDDFKEDFDPVASSPIVVAPNIDEQITILNAYAGRHLQFFSSSAELYVPDEPITPSNIALKISSRYGHSAKTQPVSLQGGTLFVDRNGSAIREYLFLDAEQSYSAEAVSLFAGHLVAEPQSITLRRESDVEEPTMLMVANTGTDDNGDTVPAAICVLDRTQKITAFARIKTNGTPLGFVAAQGGQVMALVERQMNGNKWHYLEILDASYNTDVAGKQANPDIDDFTATAGQTAFTYTFTSPASASDVAVWEWVNEAWSKVSSSDYTVDLGTKTVSFSTGRTEGDKIRINKRVGIVDLSAAADLHYAGQTLQVFVDDRALGEYTVDGSRQINLGSDRFDFSVEYGFKFIPKLTMHPFKGKGDISPTMKRQRIFRCLVQMQRSAEASIGITGETLHDMKLTSLDGSIIDETGKTTLFSGQKRVSAMGKWLIEPTVEISQVKPGPLQVRSVTYDVRY